MYYCDVCGDLSNSGDSCFRQFTNSGEEKRCKNCYNKEEVLRFRAIQSNHDISINLIKDRKELEGLSDSRMISRQQRKIADLINRIDVNKKILGVIQ